MSDDNRVIKTDSLGRVVWERVYTHCVITYVEEALDGDYIVTGGRLLLGVVLLAKLHNDTTGMEEGMTKSNSRMKRIQIYPNPFVCETVVSCWLLGVRGKEKMEIKIYDLSGRLVEEKRLTTKNQKLKTEIGEKLTSGVYFVKVKVGAKEMGGKKIVKIR
jgi:hypothetical protein